MAVGGDAVPRGKAEMVARAAGDRLEEMGLIDGPALEVLRKYLLELGRSGGHGKRKAHGNRRIQFDMLLTALLVGAMSGVELSLRSIEKLSVDDRVEDLWNGRKLCRSTVSDMMAQFDFKLLMNLMRELARNVPTLPEAQKDPDLLKLCKRIMAIDGTIYRAATDVVWAIAYSRQNGHKTSHVRLNAMIDVLEFVPESAGVTGKDDGAEPEAYFDKLKAGTVYLCDRNFTHFEFMRKVIEAKGDFVIRLRGDVVFDMVEDRPLPQDAIDAGVISDQVGRIPGSKGTKGLEDQPVRVVVIKATDRTGQEQTLRIATSLLDVEAAVIGKLYRCRWQIELFFRWLKCVAGCKHLLSHSRQGVEVQFYLAMIMALLSFLRHGRRLGKHQLAALQMVAQGNMSAKGYAWFAERREREAMLERARRERKKAEAAAAKKN